MADDKTEMKGGEESEFFRTSPPSATLKVDPQGDYMVPDADKRLPGKEAEEEGRTEQIQERRKGFNPLDAPVPEGESFIGRDLPKKSDYWDWFFSLSPEERKAWRLDL